MVATEAGVANLQCPWNRHRCARGATGGPVWRELALVVPGFRPPRVAPGGARRGLTLGRSVLCTGAAWCSTLVAAKARAPRPQRFTGAVGAAPDCPAMLGLAAASRNSLRSLRSLRSDSRDENEHERASRWPQALALQAAPGQWPVRSAGTNSPPDCLCPGLASSAPQRRTARCPHRPVPPGLCSAGVGVRTSPQPSTHAGVAGGGAGLLKVFAHATESRAPASGVAPTPWCAATPSARDCKQSGADARRAGPGQGIEPAEVPTTATGRPQTAELVR